MQLQSTVTNVSVVPVAYSKASVQVSCPFCTAIPAGNMTAVITVLAEDLVHTSVYRITFTRPPSGVCKLAALSLFDVTFCVFCSNVIASWASNPPAALQLALKNEVLWVRLQASPAQLGTRIHLLSGKKVWSLAAGNMSNRLAVPVGHKVLIEMAVFCLSLTAPLHAHQETADCVR